MPPALGIFELSWNVLCPGCGGVLDATATLKSVHKEDYECALCAAGYEPTLDEMVEVTFTVSPQVRRIAAHDPEYDFRSGTTFARSSGAPASIFPGIFDELIDEITLDAVELPPGERALLSLQLPAEFVIVFEPVTHAAQFIDVKGEPTRERQTLLHHLQQSARAHRHHGAAAGPAAAFARESHRRARAAAVWIAGDPLHDLLGKRKPFLTAKRLLTNQTFRDIYRTDTLDVDQRLKITSLTFLFTDLKGSTELYERVGDLVAYDLVRAHFRLLHEIVAAEAGAVVKTIGDAVMATFPTPDRALAAALRMREAMPDINDASGTRGSAAQDRHPRGPLPRGHPQRPAGLLRPDREHRGARAGACRVALDLRDRIGGRAPGIGKAAVDRGAHAGSATRGVARHCRRDDRIFRMPNQAGNLLVGTLFVSQRLNDTP